MVWRKHLRMAVGVLSRWICFYLEENFWDLAKPGGKWGWRIIEGWIIEGILYIKLKMCHKRKSLNHGVKNDFVLLCPFVWLWFCYLCFPKSPWLYCLGAVTLRGVSCIWQPRAKPGWKCGNISFIFFVSLFPIRKFNFTSIGVCFINVLPIVNKWVQYTVHTPETKSYIIAAVFTLTQFNHFNTVILWT